MRLKFLFSFLVCSALVFGQEIHNENWLDHPNNHWSFVNTSKIFPTREIPGAANQLPHPRNEQSILDRAFSASDEGIVTIDAILQECHSDGILIMHHGKVIEERYYQHTKPDSKHVLWSCSKSITALVAGVLIEKGLIDPEELVTHYIPELSESGYVGATVRNLLDMTVSLDASANEHFNSYNTGNWDVYLYAANCEGDGAHGQRFSYTNPSACVLGWVLEKVTGKHLTDLVSEHLWVPMGSSHSAQSGLDSAGHASASGSFSATLRDFALLGQLILEGGRGVISKEWIEDTRFSGDKEVFSRGELGNAFPGGAYRNCWWVMPDGSIKALGAYGQLLYINFKDQIVIAKFAAQKEGFDPSAFFLSQLSVNKIVEYLGDTD